MLFNRCLLSKLMSDGTALQATDISINAVVDDMAKKVARGTATPQVAVQFRSV